MAVVEGTVRVSYAGETTAEITAGEEAHVPHVGLLTGVIAADTAQAIAWRQRRLVFPEDRLADIAAELNRYNRTPQIRAEGAALKSRRLIGVFGANAPEFLIKFLQGSAEFPIKRNGDAVVIHKR